MNLMKSYFSNIIKQYIYLMLGLIISLIINLILGYTYFFEYERIYKFFKISKYTFSHVLYYASLSGYMIAIFVPIFGIFLKNSYLYFCRFLIITHIFWIITFIFEDEYDLFLEILLVCLPLPTSYYFAMRENEKFWKSHIEKTDWLLFGFGGIPLAM